EEVLSFALPTQHTYLNPKVCGARAQFAGLLAFYDTQAGKIELREIASGRLVGTMDDVANSSVFGGLNWRMTPDGKRRIHLVGDAIRVEDANGERRFLDGPKISGPNDREPELSFDGRYVLLDVDVPPPHSIG